MATTHGHRTGNKVSITYSAWAAMVQRTTNFKHRSFADYGTVPVHASFLGAGGFEAYLAAVGERPSRMHTLDRIDPAKGYVPGNLRWASKAVQEQNKERRTFYGATVAEWAEMLCVRPNTIRKRLSRRWDHARLFPEHLRKTGETVGKRAA